MIDFILHIDVYLASMTASYGMWTYAILFLIVFAETGLIVTPFLPGDSLLFAAGALCTLGTIELLPLMGLLIVAAVVGDAVNYAVGRTIGYKLFTSSTSKILNKKHLERTHAFYEKHGGRTIILARFIPIIRTFAPFVAGIGSMGYRQFVTYNIVGAVAWVSSFLLLGYYFGNQPFVKSNFTLVIGAIIVISVIPGVIELIRSKKEL